MSRLNDIRERLNACSMAIPNVEITRSHIRAGLGYLLWGVLVFVVVFGAQYFIRNADSMARKAVADLPGVTVDFSYLEPQLLPPRVTLDYLHIRYRNNKQPLLMLGSTDARLSLLPLLMGKVEVSLKSMAYGGLVEASVATGAFLDTDQVNGEITLDLVELNKVPQARNYDRTIKGFGSVQATFEGAWADPLSMQAAVTASLEKLNTENRYPIIKGGRLKDYRIDLDCTLQEGILTVRDFDLKSGDGITMKTDGIITVDKSNIYRSKLNMKGRFNAPINRLATTILHRTVTNRLKKKQAVTMTMGGNVERPQIQLQ